MEWQTTLNSAGSVALCDIAEACDIEQTSEQVGKRRSAPGVSKKLGRSGEGVSEKGEGMGRKQLIHLICLMQMSVSLYMHLVVFPRSC